MSDVPVSDGWRPLQSPGGAPGPFARLARVHVLSMGGDALMTLALAGSLFFSISPNEARGRVTLSLLLTMAPFAVVAPLLGPAIDRSRWGRRAMVIAAGAGRAVTCLLMARHIDSLLLFPSAFGALILSKAYSVAKSSLVPSAVEHSDELVEANSKLAIISVVGGFAAAVPGVVILNLLDARWVLRVGAVVFVVAAVAALRIEERRGPVPVGPGHPHVHDPHAVGPAAVHTDEERPDPEGIVRPPHTVLAAAVAMALLRAVVGFLTFLVAFGFRRLDAPSWWFGVVLAASMGSGLAGAALAPRVRISVREEHILAGCLGVTALAGLMLSRQGGLVAATTMAAVVGVAAGAGKLAFDALVQRDAPEAIRGRTFARFEAGFQLVWVAGALMPVVVPAPLDLGFASIGIGCLLAGAAYVVVERRFARGTLPV